jgi:hypothetical protein
LYGRAWTFRGRDHRVLYGFLYDFWLFYGLAHVWVESLGRRLQIVNRGGLHGFEWDWLLLGRSRNHKGSLLLLLRRPLGRLLRHRSLLTNLRHILKRQATIRLGLILNRGGHQWGIHRALLRLLNITEYLLPLYRALSLLLLNHHLRFLHSIRLDLFNPISHWRRVLEYPEEIRVTRLMINPIFLNQHSRVLFIGSLKQVICQDVLLINIGYLRELDKQNVQ